MSRLADRFWKKVRKTSGCWLWTGGTSTYGHGRMRVCRNGDRWLVLPHRLSYLLNVGDIPQGDGFHGTCVCHRCDNPRCVRPDHLFLGTVRDNNMDGVRKGRIRVPQNPRKLSWREACRARKMYAQGYGGVRKIAAYFGLERKAMRELLRGRTYKTPLRKT